MVNSMNDEVDIGTGIQDYLYEYGDTREQDLINYGKYELGSERGVKKALLRLEKHKRIFRIVHTKLRPPAVYYSIREYIPKDVLKEMIKANAKIQAAEYEAYGRIG